MKNLFRTLEFLEDAGLAKYFMEVTNRLWKNFLKIEFVLSPSTSFMPSFLIFHMCTNLGLWCKILGVRILWNFKSIVLTFWKIKTYPGMYALTLRLKSRSGVYLHIQFGPGFYPTLYNLPKFLTWEEKSQSGPGFFLIFSFLLLAYQTLQNKAHVKFLEPFGGTWTYSTNTKTNILQRKSKC